MSFPRHNSTIHHNDLQIGWKTDHSFELHVWRNPVRNVLRAHGRREVLPVKKYGYKVLQICGVWHFNTFEKNDPDTHEGGLFAPHVYHFFKMKLEASGYPKGSTDHDAYIKAIYQKEGILLNKDDIKKNPGLRANAKLNLNSHWGKYGQCLDYSQSIYMSDPAKYFALLRDERNTIDDINIINEHIVQVTYTRKEEFLTSHPNFNVVLAAWVTAQARLELCKTLSLLGCRALYLDTDSVLYIHRPGEWNPELGNSLVDFTDELNGNTIKTFVSGGPKIYAYELMNPRPDGTCTTCKVRGFTLNYRNQQRLNFDTMKGLIKGQQPGEEGKKIRLHRL
ncbi:uncharacterized protein [Haliotis cracherodii]|uniref:uncharacterized protein n=1 Tax=Haliotis cracherodii TaxID=6455 RepID=UPI0039EA82E6